MTKKTLMDHDGWIEWSGGECPVDEHLIVEIKLRDGLTMEDNAGDLFWGRDYDEDDIIAYRIVSEQPEQQAAIEAQSCGSATPATIEQRIASLRELEKQVEETRTELTRDLETLGLTWMVQGEPTIETPVPKPGKFNNAKIGSPTKYDPIHSGEICDSCGERFGRHIGVNCRP